MDLRSKLTQLFSAPPAAPLPSAAQPAQVFIHQTPTKSPVSRKTMVAACGLFLAAAWLSSAMFRKPASGARTPELSTAGVDKPRIQRIIDELTKKNADLALKQAEAAQQIQERPQNQVQPMYGMQQVPPALAQPPAKTLAEERRERAYKSLFSSPVVSVRSDDARPQTMLAQAQPRQPMEPQPASERVMPQQTERSSAAETTAPDCIDLDRTEQRLYALCEGSIIEARLENRLVGDFAGPVNALVERDQYSRDRQHLLIPKGTRLLGRAAQADRAWQQRLSVEFHRMILPDGRGVDLKNAVGLDQAGEIALKDKVNHHIPSTVATTVALGTMAAFAQMGTGGYLNGSGADLYRQSLSMQAGQTGQQMLGRSLNRPPSITIREGHPVEIYLNTDMHLPEFQPALESQFGR